VRRTARRRNAADDEGLVASAAAVTPTSLLFDVGMEKVHSPEVIIHRVGRCTVTVDEAVSWFADTRSGVVAMFTAAEETGTGYLMIRDMSHDTWDASRSAMGSRRIRPPSPPSGDGGTT
jgi:hypothetical protein